MKTITVNDESGISGDPMTPAEFAKWMASEGFPLGIDAVQTEKRPLYEHWTIVAEEGSAVNSGSAEWSFGNGATGYMGLPSDEGWEVVAMGFMADTYASLSRVQVDLMNYGNVASNAAANTIASVSLSNARDGGGDTNNARKIVEFDPPIAVPSDAILGFITRSASGSISDARVYARLCRQVGEYVAEVKAG